MDAVVIYTAFGGECVKDVSIYTVLANMDMLILWQYILPSMRRMCGCCGNILPVVMWRCGCYGNIYCIL